MSAYQNTRTLRELDIASGAVKGSAFRAFKALLEQLGEGTDYHVLNPERDAALLEHLRSTGRIYPSSINVVLLEALAADKVAAAIASRRAQQAPVSR